MNNRISRLREQTLNAINSLSHERAVLITEFYKSNLSQQVSTPVKRALAFKHILTNKFICINDGELIVGERGDAPTSVPTYPEICLHSIKDLEIKPHSKPEFSLNFKNKELPDILFLAIKFTNLECSISFKILNIKLRT